MIIFREDMSTINLESPEAPQPNADTIYNPFLCEGIETMQAFGELGHSALEAALFPSQFLIDMGRIMTNSLGIKENPLLGAAERTKTALLEISNQITCEYPRPEFGIEKTVIDGRDVAVKEKVILKKPFSQLLHFERQFESEADRRNDPKVFIVSALSGHPATLHLPTVEEMLPNADLHIIRWEDAKDVSLEGGRFGVDEYTDDVIDALLELGPDTHVMAVCQSTVEVSVAAAVIAQLWPEKQPLSLTLISGPIDTRVNATASKITDFVEKNDVDSLRQNFIGEVTSQHAGAGRKVYPGWLQRVAFYTPNLAKHIEKHRQQFVDRAQGRDAAADKSAGFYPGYNTMLDMAAEFFTETYERKFKDQQLAKGTWIYNGKYGHIKVDLGKVGAQLMTVEGGADEFCPPGQTSAAHRLFSSLKPAQRSHYELANGGHYATWAGGGFREKIAPRIRDHIYKSAAAAKRVIKYSTPTQSVIEREPWPTD